ncbi:MAG: TonB-dependent receptor plug domain-containing protein [Bacteroidaceae bacterium]|nr:TonB-dependent receptor plug domain-containing protein [Bacteroidaceae bacterium]
MKRYFLLWMMIMSCVALSAQELSGVITKNGKPKRGLTVSILGSDESTTTDKFGRFYFKNASPGDILQIDVTARKAARIQLSEARRLRVYIAPSDFVYNNGRIEQHLPYTALRSDAVVRGNIVMHDQIMSSGLHSVSDLLKNFMTGVRIEQEMMSSNIVMRGPGSIMGNTAPLFVVDGVVMESLDEVDRLVPVETISKLVLNKEGTGWGARGGNGVIEITTR